MLKYVFLAGAMTIAAPVLAQDLPASGDQAAPTAATARTVPQTQPIPADPAQTNPATPADPAAAPGAATAQADSARPMDATQPAVRTAQASAAPGDKTQQVAQIVDSEFASYDKDRNGSLSATEFDAWMVALKTAADPSTKAASPDTKKWMAAAFAQADTDKSKSVSKAELTGFLASGQG